MFKNKNGIFYSKQSHHSQIEIIQIISNNNNLPLSKHNQFMQIISFDSKGEILTYHFFEETLIVIQTHKLIIYKSFNDQSSILECLFAFYKEEQSKIKFYQIIPLHLYAISLGRTIHIIKIHNNKRIEIKTYRLHSIAIQSILSFEIKNEFTGDNIYITCQVNYDMNSPYAFCIQSFCLPNLENEVITNHNILFGQSDSDMIKIWTIDGDSLSLNYTIILYTKQKKKYCMFNHDQMKQVELKEIEQCLIDQVILISSLHIIFFCDNNKMVIYEIKQRNSLVYSSMIDYNKEGKYLMKHKGFQWNNKVYIIAFNTDNQLKGIILNKELTIIEKEDYALKDYGFDVSLDLIKKELNNGFIMKIIQGKHCEVMNRLFYNTIIQSIKKYKEITMISYKGKLELFKGRKDDDDNNKMIFDFSTLSIITYDSKTIKVLDFDIILMKDDIMILFVLLTDITHQTQLVLFNYSNKIDIKSNNTKECFDFKCSSQSDKISIRTVFNTSQIFSYISIIRDRHLYILISSYGEIKFFSYDENGTSVSIYDFTISFHNCEISEMKNEFENGNDLMDIFRLDQEIHLLTSYKFIDAFLYENKGVKENLLLFNEEYIVLVFHCGIVFFQCLNNTYTGMRKIIFYEQINKDFADVKEQGSYKEMICFDDKTEKFTLR